MAYFSRSNSTRFLVHVHHAYHHDLTTKTPSQTHTFSPNPLQKPSKMDEKQHDTPQGFFSRKAQFFQLNSTHPTTSTGSKIKTHEPLFCRWKRNNRDVAYRSAVKPVPGTGQIRSTQKVLAVPPDFTRMHSQSGVLTELAWQYYGDKLVDILPALGTHKPMTDKEIATMYGATPRTLFRNHDWRNDVVTLGEVPGEFMYEVSEGKARLHLASSGEQTAARRRPRSHPLDRPGRSPRSRRHGELQQKHLHRHGRLNRYPSQPLPRRGIRHGAHDGAR